MTFCGGSSNALDRSITINILANFFSIFLVAILCVYYMKSGPYGVYQLLVFSVVLCEWFL